MNKLPIALFVVAGIALGGCKSNDSKPSEAGPAAQTTTSPAPPPEVAATPAKPTCPPEQTDKKAKSKKKTKAKTPAPADCQPTKSQGAAPEAAKPATEPAPPPAASNTAGKACNPCVVKSKDGAFDGEVYGTIPTGSKWARLQIGMTQPEVERILGVSPNIRAYVTAKAFIPFYFGTDSHRYEAVYAGQGSVAYTGGTWGGGQGVLMMINYDPKIQ